MLVVTVRRAERRVRIQMGITINRDSMQATNPEDDGPHGQHSIILVSASDDDRGFNFGELVDEEKNGRCFVVLHVVSQKTMIMASN